MKKVTALLPLLCLALMGSAARVDTVAIRSAAMNKVVFNLVILPESPASKKGPLPVVYLLHGAGGDHKDWLTKVPELKQYSDQYGLMIVCPDGGRTSWYFDSPVDSTMRYETYVSRELVPFIDRYFPTIPHRTGRAITGLSMGGHGALYLSIRHADLFGAAGSMSGGVDFRPFPSNWDLAKRLGPKDQYPDNWEQNTVINLVDSLEGKMLPLLIDCGVDDFFFPMNRNLHHQLLVKKIPHDYIERPGRHDWNYWANAVQYQLLFFQNYFRQLNPSVKP